MDRLEAFKCRLYAPTSSSTKVNDLRYDILCAKRGEIHTVADRGVSGPWGPQFCGALCNGETQRLPAGGAGSPQVGSEARPRRQTHFGNNIIY